MSAGATAAAAAAAELLQHRGCCCRRGASLAAAFKCWHSRRASRLAWLLPACACQRCVCVCVLAQESRPVGSVADVGWSLV